MPSSPRTSSETSDGPDEPVEPVAALVAMDLDDLEREAAAYDEAVAATRGIDRFCSSSPWILGAHAAWGQRLRPWIRRGEHGYFAFLRHVEAGIRLLVSFDTMWGFSSPVVGPDPARLASDLAIACAGGDGDDGWDIALVSGLDPEGPLLRALFETLGPRHRLGRGPILRRWIASLDGGLDGFLSRRTRKFRGNVRRARSRASAAGVTVEPAGDLGAEAILARVLDIERRSWKGPAGTGLISPDILAFYRGMLGRLEGTGQTRVTFARREGRDVGYILGAVQGETYRGFQFSYDADVSELSIGSLLQIAAIEGLAADGIIRYDLGIDLDYKRHWGDSTFDTLTLAIRREPG